MSARRLTSTLLAVCGLAGVLALDAGPAAAVTQFGGYGEGAGQFFEPQGIAVDRESGDVYLVDKNNQRVDKFTGEGTFLLAWGWGVADGTTHALQMCTTTCHAGLEGAGTGQFSFPEGIAVDNDPLSPSRGDVYVDDVQNRRVEKFAPDGEFLLMFGGEVNETTKGDVCVAGEKCKAGTEGSANGQFVFPFSVAVGPTGTVYVGDYRLNRVQEFDAEGVYQSQLTIPEGSNAGGVAVDAEGDVYARSYGLSGVRKYSPSGELLQILDAEGHPTAAIALDAAGHVYIDDFTESFSEEKRTLHHVILEYDSSGKQLAAFDEGMEDGDRGIAFGDGVGELYLLNENNNVFPYVAHVRLVSPPPPGPLLVEGSESAGEVGPASAVLGASINPEGNDTTYRFEYGTSTAYGTSAPVPDADIGSGFETHAVSAPLSGLSVRTTYHYRVVASNSAGTAFGPDQTFTTLPPALIDSESASDVAATSATLRAEINPLGSDTKYHFQYGPTTACGGDECSVPVPDMDVGSGRSDVTVSPQHIQGLQPATTYHYRVVATNALGTAEGEDRTFTTQHVGGGSVLADGRQWELVSPANKHGAQFTPLSGTAGPIQAAEDGGGIVYLASVPTEAEPPGYGQFSSVDQVLSRRGAQGWSTRDIAVPHNSATYLADAEYLLFTGDLSSGIAEPESADRTLLSSEASEPTAYLRREALCDAPASAGECFLPLLTGMEGFADVPPGTKFGPIGGELGKSASPQVIFNGASRDLGHVVLHSKVALTSTPIPQSGSNSVTGFSPSELYEWSAGVPASEALQLVSVLPASEGGGPVVLENSENVGVPISFGGRYSGSRYAISDDGSRVFWEVGAKRGAPRALYVRDTVRRETVRLDVRQPGAPSGGDPETQFQIASTDGSKAFFTDGQPLTSDSGGEREHPDLYECDIVEEAGKLACRLTDLTPPRSGRSAEVLHMVSGASEDGSYVYFVANGILSENKNSAGESATQGTCSFSDYTSATCNLYEYHDGTITFVATLSIRDRTDWGIDIFGGLTELTAYASPDGRYLTFMSLRSLTGYDNRDAVSGRPDAEVYLYDAVTDRLACVSCDPTDARPVGIEAREFDRAFGAQAHREDIASVLVSIFNHLPENWVAANLPPGPAVIPGGGIGLYQPRLVSDGGRVFFNSFDALVPQDVNGNEDVYEYEPQGIGSCTAASATFNSKSGGCVSLVSSGTSPEESGLLDASKSGDDVFFLTSSRLASQDYDTAGDVYDAHVCTTSVPCVPPAVSVAPCDSGDACKGAPAPQPAVFGAPASATFNGAGNVVSSSSGPGVRGRSLTRAQKLARALHACRKKPKRKRRACERQARKQYAAARGRAGGATRRARG